jgi:hypothetical protein
MAAGAAIAGPGDCFQFLEGTNTQVGDGSGNGVLGYLQTPAHNASGAFLALLILDQRFHGWFFLILRPNLISIQSYLSFLCCQEIQ